MPRPPAQVGVPEGVGAPTTASAGLSGGRRIVGAMTTPHPVETKKTTATEECLRCGATMEWRHGTFQCPRCRFKIGCCEGLTGECSS